MTNLVEIVNQALTNGGATVDTKTGGIAPVKGYMVSLASTEKIVPLKEFNVATLENYIEVTPELNSENVYLGVWIDGDKVYIDSSMQIEDLERSVRIGMKNRQIAIFDLENQKVLNIPQPQTAGTDTQIATYTNIQVRNFLESVG